MKENQTISTNKSVLISKLELNILDISDERKTSHGGRGSPML